MAFFVIGLAIAEVSDFDARNLWEEGAGVRLCLIVIGCAPTLVGQPKDR